MKWSSICLAPSGTNGCTDTVANNGGTMHIVSRSAMSYFSHDEGTCDCTNGGNSWQGGGTGTTTYNGCVQRQTGTRIGGEE